MITQPRLFGEGRAPRVHLAELEPGSPAVEMFPMVLVRAAAHRGEPPGQGRRRQR